ncbi:MAG: ABC transporter ATP-binding protein [Promethearchaeota archaeon]
MDKGEVTEEKILDITDVKLEKESKLIQIKNLKTYFFAEEGIVKAVDGVSFDIYKDEILGLVGETGCGKSVTALSILRLVREPGKIIEGNIIYNGIDLLTLPENEIRKYRGRDITIIFQDPLNSLNPVLSIGEQISEVFLLHQYNEIKRELDQRLMVRKEKKKKIKELTQKLKQNSDLTLKQKEAIKKEINELKKQTKHFPVLKDVLLDKSVEIIKKMGIADAEEIVNRYPHELSGGMRQRIMIAMALSCNPGLLIADEPTTALDVTIQAQILDLMQQLKKKYQTSILLITHDLGIIAEMCDRVAVMYSGNIVEYAIAEELFKRPSHPYTQGLIGAIPSIEKRNKKLKTIRGMVPNLIYPPSGCRFHPRCDERLEVCDKVRPKLIEIGEKHYVACHLLDPEYKDSPKYKWTKKEKEISFKI